MNRVCRFSMSWLQYFLLTLYFNYTKNASGNGNLCFSSFLYISTFSWIIYFSLFILLTSFYFTLINLKFFLMFKIEINKLLTPLHYYLTQFIFILVLNVLCPDILNMCSFSQKIASTLGQAPCFIHLFLKPSHLLLVMSNTQYMFCFWFWKITTLPLTYQWIQHSVLRQCYTI